MNAHVSASTSRPRDLIYWARSAQSAATFQTGFGVDRRTLPALNSDSRNVLVALCRVHQHGGTENPSGGADQLTDGPLALAVSYPEIQRLTGFSGSRLEFHLACLKHAGLIVGTGRIEGPKRAETLFISLNLGGFDGGRAG